MNEEQERKVISDFNTIDAFMKSAENFVDIYTLPHANDEDEAIFSYLLHVKQDIILDSDGNKLHRGYYDLNDHLYVYTISETGEAEKPVLIGEIQLKLSDVIIGVITYTDPKPELIKILEDLEKSLQATTAKEEKPKAEKLELYKPIVNAIAPLDKLNRTFPLIDFKQEVDGQLSFGDFNFAPPQGIDMTSTEDQKEGKSYNALVSMDFSRLPEGLEVTKKIDSFDLRVMKALARLGVGRFSAQQVYKAMGGQGKMTTLREKILKSCEKMFTAGLYIDNKALVDAGYKYKRFHYSGAFINGNVIWGTDPDSFVIRGGYTSEIIEVLKMPVFIEWANALKQCTEVPLECWQCLRLTDNQIALVDYLITEIELMKRGTRNNRKIKYDSLFKALKITGRQQPRTIEKLIEVLDYYKSIDYIYKWAESKDKTGVEIIYLSKSEAEKKKAEKNN